MWLSNDAHTPIITSFLVFPFCLSIFHLIPALIPALLNAAVLREWLLSPLSCPISHLYLFPHPLFLSLSTKIVTTYF